MIYNTRMHSRADLHVHSRYSDRPSEWFLRRIGSPESFVDPLKLVETCKQRGMDYVTITDHNSIRGALEIAHLPDTFISSELTTYFPENGCKVHCLVWGVTEKIFRELDEARANIYDLHECIHRHRIAHAVAHPLFRINDRLTVEQVEKLILLFNSFEVLNGSRHPRAGELCRAVLDNLTPELIAHMADRHGIEPTGPEPWKKRFTGGSDDHSGLYTAEAHTATPPATSVFDFLGYLRDGEHHPGGRAGTSVRLAHSLYGIAYSYYEDRFMKSSGGKDSLIGSMLKKLAEEPAAPPTGLRAALVQPLRRMVLNKKKKQLGEIEQMLLDEVATIRSAPMEKEVDEPAMEQAGDARKFKAACRISQQLMFVFAQRVADQLREGGLIGSIQSVASLMPVVLGVAPYLTAFSVQHKDEAFLREVASRFPGTESFAHRSGKRAWVTDTFTDMNGVVNTIRTLATLAHREGRPLTVVTCLDAVPETEFPLKNFRPVGTFSIREYQQQNLVFPPFLEILNWLEEEEIEEVILSTPGPLGLAVRLAARMLKIRVSGIYHTDFPQYVRHFSDDEKMEEITWRYMNWFYADMERIAVPSKPYLEQLAERGFDRKRLVVMSRGVDLERFNPARRNDGFWRARGIGSEFKFLYAGRISREKNLVNLLEAFRSLPQEPGVASRLVLAGDGPDLEALKQEYDDERIHFMGRLEGDDLSQAYASADFFVFPSLTDTFGNVVLEAHASGLPAIVSDQGGPGEIVRSHDSGLVVDAGRADALADAMRAVRGDPALRNRLKGGAAKRAGASTWDAVLSQLLDSAQ